MNKIGTVLIAAILGYVTVALAAFGIALTLVADSGRDNFFWYRLVWSEFLLFIIYLPAFSFYKAASDTSRNSSSKVAILPSAKIVIIAYSFISFALMFANCYNNGEKLPGPIYLVIQIALTAIVGTIFSLMTIAGKSASTNLVKTFKPERSPNELCEFISSVERYLNSSGFEKQEQIATSLKKLRECIMYSLPKAGKYGETPDYNNLAEKIIKLLDDLKDNSYEKTDVKKVIFLIDDSIGDVKRISQMQVS